MTARSVFRDIDAKLAEHRARVADIRERGGSAVRADEFGWWRCSFRSTRQVCDLPGVLVRPTVRLKARSAAELIEQLESRADRPGARKRAKLEHATAEDTCARKVAG